jgi:hypothetical protein
MRGAIGSLNAAVAGSVLLFEALGQRDPDARPSVPAAAPSTTVTPVDDGASVADGASTDEPGAVGDARRPTLSRRPSTARKASTKEKPLAPPPHAPDPEATAEPASESPVPGPKARLRAKRSGREARVRADAGTGPEAGSSSVGSDPETDPGDRLPGGVDPSA